MWLVKSELDGRSYAAKQFPITDGAYHPSADQEMQIQNLLFPMETKKSSKVEENEAGFNALSRICYQIQTDRDLWLIYTLGAKSLFKVMFDIDVRTVNGGKNLLDMKIKGNFNFEKQKVFLLKHHTFYKII